MIVAGRRRKRTGGFFSRFSDAVCEGEKSWRIRLILLLVRNLDGTTLSG